MLCAEVWVMTKSIRSQVQAAEMSFLRWVAGISLRDRVRSSVTRKTWSTATPSLGKVSLGGSGHLVRMPLKRLPRKVLYALPTGRRPRGRPKTRWRKYISTLDQERLGIPPEEVDNLAWEREHWEFLHPAIPPNQIPDKKSMMDRWIINSQTLFQH